MLSSRFVTGFKSPLNGRFKATNLADGLRLHFPFPSGVADFSLQYQNYFMRSASLILPSTICFLKMSSNPIACSYLLCCCLAALV
jgi:hypothetical protein